jgi:hypothetical protein
VATHPIDPNTDQSWWSSIDQIRHSKGSIKRQIDPSVLVRSIDLSVLLQSIKHPINPIALDKLIMIEFDQSGCSNGAFFPFFKK